MKSPCVKVCVMDPERDACVGCCRTLEEIALWGRMSDGQRDAVMQELPERRARLNLPQVKFEDGHGT
jgi:predicted Fe-S protein YdhL (DUF1289 family)